MIPQRRTRRRYEAPGQARYLTCSCFHRLALFGNDRIKDAFVERLTLVINRTGCNLFCWVVMPEHFHLLLRPVLPRVTVTHFLMSLKRPFAALVLDRWRELGAKVLRRVRDSKGQEHFWQEGGGYDRNVYSRDELLEKIAYIHMNPVRRGLVARPEDWQWSSLGCGGDRAPKLTPV
jgi:putative transposase